MRADHAPVHVTPTERSVLDQLDVAVIVTDVDGVITDWNRHAEAMYGWSAQEAIGREAIELLIPAEGRQGAGRIMDLVVAGGPWEGEIEILRKDGTPVLAHVSDSLLYDPAGRPSGVIGVSFDVTERRRAERRLALQYAVTRALSEAGTLADAAPKVLEAVCGALGWRLGVIWALEEGSSTLRCVDVWLAPGTAATRFVAACRGARFAPGVGLPGRVFEAGEPLWIPDVATDEGFTRAALATEAGLHGALAFPIALRGQSLGVVEFFSERIDRPDDDLLAMLAGAGGQVGQFVERTQAEAAVRDSEARTRAIVQSALDSVIAIDAAGRITEFNPAAERTFGYRREDVLGLEMAELIVPPRFRRRHRAGLSRALDHGEGSLLGRRVELAGMRADGEEFPVEVTVTRVEGPGPVLFTGYLRDITERRRAEEELARLLGAEQESRRQAEVARQQLAFLAEAGNLLASSLDFASALQGLGEMAVSLLADACLVDVLDADGSVRRMVAVHADPGMQGLMAELGAHPPDPRGANPAVRAMRSKRSEFDTEITEEFLRDIARDERHHRLIRDLGFQSYIAVPLVARGRVLGAITLLSTNPDRRYGPADVALAEDLARRTALTIDNARLYDAEQEARQRAERLYQAEQAARSEAEEGRRRLAFLAEASKVLAKALQDYERTLADVAQLAVPTFADWCAVDLAGEGQSIQRVAIVHSDPEKRDLAVELQRRYPPDPEAPFGVANVLRTGQPEVVPEIAPEMLAAAAPDAEWLSIVSALGLRSSMIVPLVARGRTVGAISFASAESGRRYGDGDLVLAEELAQRAALAVDNARLFRERSHVARTLQQSLLPPQLPRIPGVEIAALYRPAGEGAEIGGDFYDLFETADGDWAVVIGDVCGKGADAASVIGLVRYTVRALATQERRPSRILAMLNEALRQQVADDQFCTVAYLRLRPQGDGMGLTLSCGGHPLPLVLRSAGGVEPVGEPGTLLGVFPDPRLSDHAVRLEPGDALVLYTDGVVEERSAEGTMFGDARLSQTLLEATGASAEEIARTIEAEVMAFRPEAPRDDMAILVLQVTR
jgi:PAS domain S-box-containing protein